MANVAACSHINCRTAARAFCGSFPASTLFFFFFSPVCTQSDLAMPGPHGPPPWSVLGSPFYAIFKQIACRIFVTFCHGARQPELCECVCATAGHKLKIEYKLPLSCIINHCTR